MEKQKKKIFKIKKNELIAFLLAFLLFELCIVIPISIRADFGTGLMVGLIVGLQTCLLFGLCAVLKFLFYSKIRNWFLKFRDWI